MSSLFNAGLYSAIATITVFIVFFWNLSACTLFGLHAYLLPDDKPGDDPPNSDKKQPKKKKDRFVWNEGGSEILRITIGDSYLKNTRYFPEYDQTILYSALAISLLVAREYVHVQLGCNQQEGGNTALLSLGNDALIPVLVTTFSLLKLVHILHKVSWDKHSSRNSEWIISCGVGVVGFTFACVTLFMVPGYIIDFGLEQAVTESFVSSSMVRFVIAVAAGCLTGLSLGPAIKCVRTYWLGTNQLGWDLPVVKTGSWRTFLLNLSMVLPVVTALLWFKPMAELFIRDGAREDWSGGFGLSQETFEDVKFVGIVLTGVTQMLLLRVNIQSYLNLAVLSWYESLHGSRTPDKLALKTKLLVINHFMCRVATQNLVPAAMVVLFAGLSRSSACPTTGEAGSALLLAPRFVGQVALFFSWWLVLSWALLTCGVLALFRFGLLLAY